LEPQEISLVYANYVRWIKNEHTNTYNKENNGTLPKNQKKATDLLTEYFRLRIYRYIPTDSIRRRNRRYIPTW